MVTNGATTNSGESSDVPAGPADPRATPPSDRPTIEPMTFVGSQGAQLAGLLHRPPGPARGSVLLAHCFTCSKDTRTLVRLAKGLADAGYVVLRFDFTGIGDSDGEFATKTVSGNVGDLVRAATALIERNLGPCVLIGHSLGGAAALLAAERLKTVTAVVTIGAPSSVGHVTRLFDTHVETLQTEGRAIVTIGGRSFELARSFIDDLDNHDVLDAAANLQRPLLVVHARDDSVVDHDQALQLFAAASEPKQLLSLDHGDHLLGPIDAAEQALYGITEWLERVDPRRRRARR